MAADKRTKAEILAELEALGTQYINLTNQYVTQQQELATLEFRVENQSIELNQLGRINNELRRENGQLRIDIENAQKRQDEAELYTQDIVEELGGQREVFQKALESVVTTAELALDALSITR
jgi:pyruvate/2-oxoacid:ferredoxin oxidoreductase beta subunit